MASMVLAQQQAPHPSTCYSSLSAKAASSAAAIEAERCIREGPRNNWTKDEINSIYHSPVLDLLFHGVSSPSYSFFQVKELNLIKRRNTRKMFGHP